MSEHRLPAVINCTCVLGISPMLGAAFVADSRKLRILRRSTYSRRGCRAHCDMIWLWPHTLRWEQGRKKLWFFARREALVHRLRPNCKIESDLMGFDWWFCIGTFRWRDMLAVGSSRKFMSRDACSYLSTSTLKTSFMSHMAQCILPIGAFNCLKKLVNICVLISRPMESDLDIIWAIAGLETSIRCLIRTIEHEVYVG